MTIKLEQKKLFGIDLENFSIDRRIEERIEKRSEDEILVFGSRNGIYAFDGKEVKRIARRDSCVWALAVWNGELYDGSGFYGKIYRTRDSKVILQWDSTITCMLPVKRSVLKGMI